MRANGHRHVPSLRLNGTGAGGDVIAARRRFLRDGQMTVADIDGAGPCDRICVRGDAIRDRSVPLSVCRRREPDPWRLRRHIPGAITFHGYRDGSGAARRTEGRRRRRNVWLASRRRRARGRGDTRRRRAPASR